MSSMGYFSVNPEGKRESPLRSLLRLREERVALALAQRAREDGRLRRPEKYDEVKDYDPVLRWHCRL